MATYSQDNGSVTTTTDSPFGGGSLTSPGGSLSTPSSSGSSSPSTNSVVIGIAAQTFRVTCTGLKPNTLHKAYLVSKDVSTDCAPIASGNVTTPYVFGANLLSNSVGYLQFDYAFKPQNSPFQTQYISSSNQTIAIIPAGNQNFKVSSVDGNSHAESFIISKGTVSA